MRVRVPAPFGLEAVVDDDGNLLITGSYRGSAKRVFWKDGVFWIDDVWSVPVPGRGPTHPEEIKRWLMCLFSPVDAFAAPIAPWYGLAVSRLMEDPEGLLLSLSVMES